MSVHITADWHEIGQGQYFRKTELYTMGWSSTSVPINLDDFALVGGSYGGLLAMIKDDKKFTRVTPNVTVKPIISIYTPSGTALASMKWDSGVLVKMGWSSSEDLLCVQEDGNVLVYTIFGILTDTFHCLAEYGPKEKAYEAEIFPSTNGTGIAFLTTKENFIILNNYKYSTTKCYARVPGGGPFSTWAVRNVNRQTSVIVSKDSVIYSADMSQCEVLTTVDKLFSAYKSQDYQVPTVLPLVTYISISLNGEHAAVYIDSGMIWIGSSDFRRKYCEIPTSNPNRPKQIVWCGTEAVAVSWEGVPSILLINRTGNQLTFPMDCAFHLISEIDSMRVVTNYSHDVVQKVPENTKLIFGIGSVAAGSWLLEASKEFSQKSHKADDYMKCIDNIEEAVHQCIETAGYEFDPSNQKLLMKAAQFGKSFLTKYNPEPYVHMCQMLRILNAVKEYRVAMPLTFTQLEHMSISVLIDRLIYRRHYSLATKIAEFLKLRDSQGKSRILSRWACYKVGQITIDEDKLAAEIHSKLKSDPSISYSEIANKALDAGRKKLALSLAHYEVRGSVKVPLFLKLGDTKTALHKAVETGNPELIYDVLIKLRDTMPASQFQLLVRNYPAAQAMYIKYCEIFCPEAVRNIYETEDDYSAQAILSIRESFKEARIETKMTSLQQAQQLYLKGKNDFAASLCEEQNKLLKHQLSLEQKYNNTFVNLSLRDTIKTLLVIKEVKMAEKLRQEYKVSDRMFWMIRLATLAELRDWHELENLSKTKKMPGGFEDFVEVCLQYKNLTEAKKYLPKVKDSLQIKYYVQAGLYEEAARIAVTRKDTSEFEYILSKCDRDTAAKVKEILEGSKTPNAGPSSSSDR